MSSIPIRSVGALVVVLLVGALGRCGEGVPAAEIRDKGYGCGFTGDEFDLVWDVNPQAGTVPRGFDPVEAVWCQTPDALAGEDEGFAVTEVRSTVLEPLVERFATPDAPADPGVQCSDMHILDSLPARIWLLDSGGRAILGHSPMRVCGPNNVGLDEAFAQGDG